MRAQFFVVISLAVAFTGSTGCGDDCAAGPGDAGQQGLSLTTSAGAFVYGRARSSPNNDCTPFQGRDPTSLTVDMIQVDPATETSLFLTLCIPEPDNLEDGSYALGFETSGESVLLIDVFGRSDDGDVFQLDSSAAGLDATIDVAGYCSDGSAPEGYAIALAGSVPVTSSAGAEIATFGGAAIAVEAQLTE